MNIICPKCQEVFSLSATDQQKILTQIRDQAFENEVEKRVAASKEKLKEIVSNRVEKAVAKTNEEHLQKEIKLRQSLSDMQSEVTKLKGELQLADKEKEVAIQFALNEQKVKHDEMYRQLETELNYYKDLKTKMSTKMVGETLEQHCWTQFNQIRATAFPNAYFEKDNVVSKSGSKGDFIFRESQDGIEFLSIMFEMKNEMDTTTTKHHNEDFFKELDRDRREKNCEYAVLVSLLESDSELYNVGIVDVSYRYPKMYVIRPQFFIPMITVLRNAALHSIEARKELLRIQQADVDVERFEENLLEFKERVGRNYELASKQFQQAIDEIDKSIDHMQKVRKALVSSERNLRLMNDKTDDLSLRGLAKNSPSLLQIM